MCVMVLFVCVVVCGVWCVVCGGVRKWSVDLCLCEVWDGGGGGEEE